MERDDLQNDHKNIEVYQKSKPKVKDSVPIFVSHLEKYDFSKNDQIHHIKLFRSKRYSGGSNPNLGYAVVKHRTRGDAIITYDLLSNNIPTGDTIVPNSPIFDMMIYKEQFVIVALRNPSRIEVYFQNRKITTTELKFATACSKNGLYCLGKVFREVKEGRYLYMWTKENLIAVFDCMSFKLDYCSVEDEDSIECFLLDSKIEVYYITVRCEVVHIVSRIPMQTRRKSFKNEGCIINHCEIIEDRWIILCQHDTMRHKNHLIFISKVSLEEIGRIELLHLGTGIHRLITMAEEQLLAAFNFCLGNHNLQIGVEFYFLKQIKEKRPKIKSSYLRILELGIEASICTDFKIIKKEIYLFASDGIRKISYNCGQITEKEN